jgi:hypothetical protein
MIGNTFLHGGLFHLIGNMIFLWVFGSAVCATVGNVAYPFLYLFLGVCASASHLIFDGRPALGASGAINGVVGMSLILFPVNRLHCWYFFSLPFAGILWKSGRFKVRAYWMIFAWVVFDILGVIVGGGDTAYWAHIGGFVTGLVAGSALIYFKVAETYDPTFFDVLAGRPLERTDYDLNEIAAMPLAETASALEARLNVPQPSRVDLKRNQPQSAVAAVLQDPKPVLRVTSVVPKGNDLMIFFVNEGDPIRNVSLASPAGILQPAVRLGTREMGTMRLSGLAQQSLGNLDLSVSFLAGSVQMTKRMLYNEATQKFAAK